MGLGDDNRSVGHLSTAAGLPFLSSAHYIYTLAAHQLHWLVLGGTKACHRCMISSAVKIFPNLRADEAVVGKFVLWAGEEGVIFAE